MSYATEIADLIVGRTFSADSGLVLLTSRPGSDGTEHKMTVETMTDPSDGNYYEIIIRPCPQEYVWCEAGGHGRNRHHLSDQCIYPHFAGHPEDGGPGYVVTMAREAAEAADREDNPQASSYDQ
jgi:hypothetical protein